MNERLSAYLDGELSADESAELERTLSVDPALRFELEELAEVKRMVGHLPRHAAPASIKSAIRDQLERRSLLHPAGSGGQTLPAGLKFLRILSAAAAVVLACAVSVTVWQRLNPPPADHADNPTMKDLAQGNDLGEGPAAASSATRLQGPNPDAGTTVASARPDRAKEAEKWLKDADLAKPGAGDFGRKGGEESPAPRSGGAAGLESASAPRPETIAKAGIADKSEGLSLDDRFENGPVTAGDVAKLHFNNEAVQLDVPVANAEEQKKVIADVRDKVRANGGNEIKELAANTRLTPNDHQFVYEGKPNLNFTQNGNQSQVVLRANSEVIGKVVDQVQKDSNGQAQLNVQASRLRGGKREAVEQVSRQSRANVNADPSGNGNLYVGQTRDLGVAAKPPVSPGNAPAGPAPGRGYGGEGFVGKVATAPGAVSKIDAIAPAGAPAKPAAPVAPLPSPIIVPHGESPVLPASQPAWDEPRGTADGNPREARLPEDRTVTADRVVAAAKVSQNGTGDVLAPASQPASVPRVVSAQPVGEDGKNLSQAQPAANGAPGPVVQQADQKQKPKDAADKSRGGRGNDMLDVVINVYVPAGGQGSQGSQGKPGEAQQLNPRPAPPQQQAGPNLQDRPITEAPSQADRPASAPAGN